MTDQLLYFSGLGALLGFTHTILGPDHYIPFVFLSKARHWTTRKTMIITALCGLGHVLSSVAIGFIGIALSKGVDHLTNIEEVRGGWAAWGFTFFGAGYMFWGIYRAFKNKPHRHFHEHGKKIHEHEHVHDHSHDHLHKTEKVTNLTPWALFIIFVFGPCEPLIPVIIYPAIEERGSISEAVIVSSVFMFVTILTMLTIVFLLHKGVNFIRLSKFERYTHALAGAMLLLSGLGILFLNL